ncbi:DNA cytosine methyltransferase [Campylobacter lari]|uniref:DNA cytosine methyltransferase n=1 Tax=unclassified Campylobacter TaxID=2593542 RepID=UPI0021E90F7A|nr:MULTISPECIES: DNA cytosine methyltransferase [unclassified Campylobacter]EGG0462655.1 DNA cytosine methyltransferase [Campylobacter lari]MCR8677718.1 DNA cytosine methyltransferase [Campylobacter sp. S4:11]EGK8096653.1 DNA cytosine methyltransferase [Campylobacter lari]MCV3375692.1 DNA cytosine methyltransferase [Campylobacter sp. IFREMER_LSEM_CL2151]MCV3392030.1 DNA cytosine methyltransferase [Campylobacter sp. IFREMER_LSEM_CL2101]
MEKQNEKYTCIDLFAGAGGLSLGFKQTNRFDILAHIEWEKPMVETLRNDLVKRFNFTLKEAKKRVIRFDIQKVDELINGSWSEESLKNYINDNDENIAKYGLNGLLNGKNIDIIIGGPPCQAYSIAGRAQDKNSMKNDYRNYLFESFAKIVDYYKPKCFVFENVPGMLSAKPGNKFITHRIYSAFAKIGYDIKNPNQMKDIIYNSNDYDVPQIRNRVIIFGVKKNNEKKQKLTDFYTILNNLKSKNPPLMLKDVLKNLPKFKPLKIPIKIDGKNISHELVSNFNLTQNFPRFNNQRDLKAMKFWVENSMNNATTKEKLDFYTKITGKISKHNKYRNLEWDKPSPTLVSHLQKDGFMFIHPSPKQNRSITIREAAILQTFPNDFEFIGSQGSCFKMIGNAVPVNFAKHIALAVAKVLDERN